LKGGSLIGVIDIIATRQEYPREYWKVKAFELGLLKLRVRSFGPVN